jgi:hypothetical protein
MKAIEFHKLFYTPVWRFEYPDFDSDAEFLVKYLSKDEHYISEREKNGLQITRANLHKDEKLNKLRDFFIACCETAMDEMGYEPKCGLTSMWATRHRAGGFHHQHHHVNSFLGGSFHLFDIDKKSASGTVMANMDTAKYVIQPALNGKEKMLKNAEIMPFIPGTLVLFPAWASHFTQPTACRYRIIVAMNAMPIGKSNSDHFDRYNYSDPVNMDLKEYGE